MPWLANPDDIHAQHQSTRTSASFCAPAFSTTPDPTPPPPSPSLHPILPPPRAPTPSTICCRTSCPACRPSQAWAARASRRSCATCCSTSPRTASPTAWWRSCACASPRCPTPASGTISPSAWPRWVAGLQLFLWKLEKGAGQCSAARTSACQQGQQSTSSAEKALKGSASGPVYIYFHTCVVQLSFMFCACNILTYAVRILLPS